MLSLLVVAVLLPVKPAFAEGAKQPVFLLCPHNKKYDAWSLYLNVDPSDPSKVQSLGLEKLVGVNSLDLGPNGYEHSLEAQQAAKTTREQLGTLPVAEFGSRQIKIEKDDALHVGIAPATGNAYRLMISMRCTSDQRFNVGMNKEAGKREILVKYDPAKKTWAAYADKMKDAEGEDLAKGNPQVTGIDFVVTGTGIYRIVVVFPGGDAAVIVDGWRRPE
jgi:hypothetical protein